LVFAASTNGFAGDYRVEIELWLENTNYSAGSLTGLPFAINKIAATINCARAGVRLTDGNPFCSYR